MATEQRNWKDSRAGRRRQERFRVELPSRLKAPALMRSGLRTKKQSLDGKNLLCITNGMMPAHLEEVASLFGAGIILADAEECLGAGATDVVLPHADCVLCPLSCIDPVTRTSLRRHCRLTGKSFMPLRNTSRTCLRHAVMRYADQLQGVSD
tara:strand:- start:115016 stop:115471 length:456 start_codon:yes stop_codon:yes gene_type:complete